jgi:hypothetical protein
MRHTILALAIATAGLGGGRALATPLEPATVPASATVVGHLDVDALRQTQLFTAAGGQAAIDRAIERAPADVRDLARSVAGSLRGVTFWGFDDEGAVLVQTRDAGGLATLFAKAPVKRVGTVAGVTTYTSDDHDDNGGFAAVVGDTLVLADAAASLERSIRVLTGHATTLAGSRRLPLHMRQGVFVFVTIGDDALDGIQKSANAKLLKLAIKSIVLDVGETAGVLTATAHAEMGTAEALEKARSILEGLRAMASLSDEPAARALLDDVTITANGLALDVVAKVPVARIAKMIEFKD